jgi:putative membrane protein insertion efficiency factor
VSLPARALVALVQLYRVWVSPLLLPSCRFTPTCSEYAVDALRTRGAVVGLGLTVVRVVKCAPWHPGGWDPVPPRPHDHRVDVDPAAHPDGGHRAATLHDLRSE